MLNKTERLYIEQLKSALGDILAISKPKMAFKPVWQERVERAEHLLRKNQDKLRPVRKAKANR